MTWELCANLAFTITYKKHARKNRWVQRRRHWQRMLPVWCRFLPYVLPELAAAAAAGTFVVYTFIG